MPGAEALFARWSRLKSDDRKRIGHAQANSIDRASGSGPSAAPMPDARVPEGEGTGMDSASCEALDFSSDFSVYVREGVSDAVQIAALRRLWLTSPLFGAGDGLDTYCADYSCGLPQDLPRSVGESEQVSQGHKDDRGRRSRIARVRHASRKREPG